MAESSWFVMPPLAHSASGPRGKERVSLRRIVAPTKLLPEADAVTAVSKNKLTTPSDRNRRRHTITLLRGAGFGAIPLT